MCVSVNRGIFQKNVRVLKTKQNKIKNLFTNSALHSHISVMKCKLKSKGQDVCMKKFIKLYSKWVYRIKYTYKQAIKLRENDIKWTWTFLT